jgi:DNA-binding transcriptional ArsR family regulator
VSEASTDDRPGADEGWEPVDGVDPPEDVVELTDIDLLAELTHPMRSRILRALRRPHAVAEVAETLDMPVTRLYHHVNRLESLGFVRVVATRRVGAVTERRYQVTALSWHLDRDLFETSDRAELAVALGSLFDVTKLSFQREIEHGAYDDGSDPSEHSILTRGAVTLSPPRRAELLRRLKEILDEFGSDADEDDPDATRMELFIAAFPDTS